MSHQTIWEYKYFYYKSRTDERSIERVLNEFGNNGWELVTVVFGSGQNSEQAKIHAYIFKRPKN